MSMMAIKGTGFLNVMFAAGQTGARCSEGESIRCYLGNSLLCPRETLCSVLRAGHNTIHSDVSKAGPAHSTNVCGRFSTAVEDLDRFDYPKEKEEYFESEESESLPFALLKLVSQRFSKGHMFESIP
eukprot:751523-Hanusia_phi.AAC.1